MTEYMLSPASGRVIRIRNSGTGDQQTKPLQGLRGQRGEAPLFKKRGIKNAAHAAHGGEEGERIVTIFMHLHNVHITTAPLDGLVKKITPEKGLFKPAFLRSSDFNTKNTIELSTAYGAIKIVQIAGFFTRKIICEVKEGQSVQKGERLGKICLGSRVDLSIPEGFEILVKEGARVKCKKTSLASWVKSPISDPKPGQER
jgi:phosphatidylserine decarboxylase precursor-related protein